jgi:hypothetical protein
MNTGFVLENELQMVFKNIKNPAAFKNAVDNLTAKMEVVEPDLAKELKLLSQNHLERPFQIAEKIIDLASKAVDLYRKFKATSI